MLNNVFKFFLTKTYNCDVINFKPKDSEMIV